MKVKIGCHVKMSGTNNYLIGSVNDAISYNANCFMIFLGPPQNSRRTSFDKLNIKEFNDILKDNNFDKNDLVVHLPYIVNLSNPLKKEVRDFGVNFLISEIELADKVGISKLVLHPGSKLTGSIDESLEYLSNGLNEIIKQTPNSDSIICLETMAGKGNEVGINFDQLSIVIKGVKDKKRIGVCFDTCHLNDAGYDMSDFDKVLDEFDRLVGIEYLKVIHLNDSKNEINSHKDRHDNIGHGKIGFDNLIKVVYNKRTEDIVKILETPYVGDKAVYKEEIENILNKTFKPVY